jgi:hypothetical protein
MIVEIRQEGGKYARLYIEYEVANRVSRAIKGYCEI